MNALSIVTTEKDYVKLKLDISKLDLKFFILKSNFYLKTEHTKS